MGPLNFTLLRDLWLPHESISDRCSNFISLCNSTGWYCGAIHRVWSPEVQKKKGLIICTWLSAVWAVLSGVDPVALQAVCARRPGVSRVQSCMSHDDNAHCSVSLCTHSPGFQHVWHKSSEETSSHSARKTGQNQMSKWSWLALIELIGWRGVYQQSHKRITRSHARALYNNH